MTRFRVADDRRQLYQGPSPQCRGPGREISASPAQKGAEQRAAHGDRLPRSACKSGCYRGYGSRLLPGIAPDRGDRDGVPAGARSQPKGYDTNEIIAEARKLGMEPEGKTGLRPGDIQVAASRGKRIPGVQAVARRGDPLCQESGVVPGHLPATGSDDLEQTLLTTPLR